MRRSFDWLGLSVTRLKGEILYTFASVLTSIVAFFGSIIAARALSPEKLGIMQALLLIPVYCTFLPLGVFNGLNRNIAFYLGRQERAKVQVMVNSSWFVAVLVSALGALIGIAFCIYFVSAGYAPLFLTGMIFVLVALITEPLTQHLEIVYMSSRNFHPLGVKMLWQNVIAAVGNLLPMIGGVIGFVASRCIYYSARLLLRWPGVPIKAIGRGTFKETSELAITGLPLLIAGTLYGYLGVADRSVVACFMLPVDLGHYTLATLVVTANQFIPFCLATLLYPRIAACYGNTGSARQLRRYFWILLGLNTAVVLPMSIATYFLVGPLTRSYLPKYVEGIPAARIACLSMLAFIYFGLTSIIAVMRRNTLYIVAIVISLALVWLLGGYWIHQGYGILGVVWARTIASGILCLFTIGFAYWLTDDRRVGID